MNLVNIAIHHFGAPAHNPTYRASVLKEVDINTLHRGRWPDFPSQLNGSYIGYNVIVWPDGSVKQYRYLGEETAAQKGHNTDTVSICLAGNFSPGAEKPTLAQIMQLKALLRELISVTTTLKVKKGTTLSLGRNRIYPHRGLQSGTACYGTALSDTWAKNLIADPKDLLKQISLLKKLIELYKLLLARKRFGGMSGECTNNRG